MYLFRNVQSFYNSILSDHYYIHYSILANNLYTNKNIKVPKGDFAASVPFSSLGQSI